MRDNAADVVKAGFKASGDQGFKKSKNRKSQSNIGGQIMLKTYKDLKVWQKAYTLTLEIYKITKKFPKEEIYGLTSQIRRSAVSVISNIAEGYARHYKQEYIQFLNIAYGSLAELETQLMLSKDLDYIDQLSFKQTISQENEVERMLSALIKSLKRLT